MARNSSIFLAASLRFTSPFWITRTESSLGAPCQFGPLRRGCQRCSGTGRSSRSVGEAGDRPGIVADFGDLLVGDRLCRCCSRSPGSAVRCGSRGRVLSKCSCAMPHRVVRRQVLLADAAERQVAQRDDQQDHPDDDRVWRTAAGRFITRLTSLPQNPARLLRGSWSSAGGRPASSATRDGFQFARNGTRNRVAHAQRVDLVAQDASTAASTVIDRIAASMTEAMSGVGDRLQEAQREQQQLAPMTRR